MNWISVKDRLPEKQKNVLMHCVWHSAATTHIYIGYKTVKKWKLDGKELLVGWIVTHWMPLPSLPNNSKCNI